jgi:hypothetical protein
MAKEARVWRTYVKETDHWDKEMVEGRNKYVDLVGKTLPLDLDISLGAQLARCTSK